MKPTCALCGRPTVPAVYIGAEPVGPTCARRAGLLKLKGGRVRLASEPAPTPPPVQLDLLAAL